MPVTNIRVLVLEDDHGDAELELRELRRAGLKVTHLVVADETSFVSALQDFKPDVILSDFSMPGFNGLAALQIAQERAADTPFVFVSGTLGEDFAIRALKDGATDYVLKTNLARLPAAVERSIAEWDRKKQLQRAALALTRAQSMAKLAHVVTGVDGVFESWSDRLPEIIGQQNGQMPRSTRQWLELLHPDDREIFRRKSIEAGRTGNRVDVNYRLKRGDGRWIHIRQAIEPLSMTRRGIDDGEQWFSTLQDVTDQVEVEAAARELEDNYRSVFNNATIGILVLDEENRPVSANPALARILGHDSGEEVLVKGSSMVRDLYVDRREHAYCVESLQRDGQLSGFETRWRRKDGAEIWVSLNAVEVRGEGVGTARQFCLVEDIAARKYSDIQIKRLNRVYAVFSGINVASVRIRNRDELFREVCRIAVEVGGFKLAWVGTVDKEATQISVVVAEGAWAGYTASMPTSLDDSEGSVLGPLSRAVRLKAPIVSNDIANDHSILLREMAVARGFRSLVILPLVVGDEVAAILALYADVPDFFDDKELQLLTDLAGDLSFAMDHIAKLEKLDYISFFDELTGLANRRLLIDRLSIAARAAQEQRGKFALALFDIERFKTINDTLGRPQGDALLAQFAKRLVTLVGEPSRVAHIGADRFAMMIPDVSAEERVARVIQSVVERIEGDPFHLGTELRISVKTGIALYPADGADPDSLFRNAEAALKKAKISGEKYLFYTQQMTERIAERLSLENKLRLALERQEFVLHYHPKVDVETRALVGLEALIRWNSSEGLIPPLKFVPLLEETGLIVQVGHWALKQAALHHRSWTEQGLKPPRVAVNVSAIQLARRDFVDLVEAAIMEAVAPVGIDLEITESLIGNWSRYAGWGSGLRSTTSAPDTRRLVI